MSYLFVLPALVGASALLVDFDAAEGWRSLAPAVLTIGTAMVMIIPAIDTFFVFAQPRPGNPGSEILPTVAVPVLLAALVIQLALVYRLRLKDAGIDDVSTDEPAPGPIWDTQRAPDCEVSMKRSSRSPQRARSFQYD